MKQRRLILSTLALCGSLCAGLSQAGMPQAPQDRSNKGPAFTIVGARVFDGERWLPAGTQVRVQHGLVLAVGPDVGLPRGGVLIDATGETLMPETADAGDSKPDTERAQSGRGAIVTGARADLRLIEGGSQDWSGMGEIVARWRSGVLVGGRRFGSSQPL
jgi:hypothetical protein